MCKENLDFGFNGEVEAKDILRKHFKYLRRQKHNASFDYIGIDRITGVKTAIEVKTLNKHKIKHGKYVHIENGAFQRKVDYCKNKQRIGIVFLVVKNGDTEYYLSALKQHISRGMLVEIK